VGKVAKQSKKLLTQCGKRAKTGASQKATKKNIMKIKKSFKSGGWTVRTLSIGTLRLSFSSRPALFPDKAQWMLSAGFFPVERKKLSPATVALLAKNRVF
jgi:hypothetical protein